MQTLVIVFLGGGLGSVVRFSMSKWINSLHTHHFPWGTLGTNVVACLALGLIIGLADHKQLMSPEARLFWTVGFCGGYSTFSTFSYETITLIQNGFTGSSITYVALSVLLCVAATYGGLMLGENT